MEQLQTWYSDSFFGVAARDASARTIYGQYWRSRQRLDVVYELFRLDLTNELCLVRIPIGSDDVDWSEPLIGLIFTVLRARKLRNKYPVIYVVVRDGLGRGETDDLLAGWQSHIDDRNGLDWLVDRLGVPLDTIP